MASPLVDFQCSQKTLTVANLKRSSMTWILATVIATIRRIPANIRFRSADDKGDRYLGVYADANPDRGEDVSTFTEPPATSLSIVATTVALSGSLTLTTTLVSTVSILQSTSPILTTATPPAMIGLAVIVGIQSLILLPILFLFCRRRWRARLSRAPDAEEGNFIVQRVRRQ
ncbi:hypothetical protein MKEN_00573000 [Mycena kentingensis (nom. inval.)]|nr:hypothetical protein MKEN_00573000 [Mycena kentingensis (nom. inval.)]